MNTNTFGRNFLAGELFHLLIAYIMGRPVLFISWPNLMYPSTITSVSTLHPSTLMKSTPQSARLCASTSKWLIDPGYPAQVCWKKFYLMIRLKWTWKGAVLHSTAASVTCLCSVIQISSELESLRVNLFAGILINYLDFSSQCQARLT